MPTDLTGAAAAAVGAAVAVAALLLRVIAATPGAHAPGELTTALLGVGAACLAALLRIRRAAAAGLVAVVAAAIGALEIVGLAQAWRPGLDAVAWRPWLLTAVAALLAAAVAGAFAAAGGRADLRARTRRVIAAGALAGVLVIVAASAWAIVGGGSSSAVGPADPTPLRLLARIAFAGIALATAVAAWRLLAGPVDRARLASQPHAPTGTAASRRLIAFAWALRDDLLESAGRRQVADSERARLAADLHARVMPGLRHAANAAAAPDVPADVANDLRSAIAEVQTLMDARESIVLDEFGLVAALEWLAERTEDRSGLEVAIELDPGFDEASVTGQAARDVFRVATLAVENVVRHAGASRLSITMSTAGSLARLRIEDDGHGFATSPAPRPDARGIRDMHAAARALGGALTIGPRSATAAASAPAGAGTTVELAWPAGGVAGDHATAPAPIADRAAFPAD